MKPPHQDFSIDAPQLTKRDINKGISLFKSTWTKPKEPQTPKLHHHFHNYMHLRMDFSAPQEIRMQLPCSLRVPLARHHPYPHRIHIEIVHCLQREHCTCSLCMSKSESEYHFIFRCPIYKDIHDHFHCLFKDPHGSLRIFI